MNGNEVRAVSAPELQAAIQLSSAMQTAAQRTVTNGQFTFVAAFDGTNNDRSRPSLSGDPLSTNVAQLAEQVATENPPGGTVETRYYSGVGTNGSGLITDSTWIGPAVTAQVVSIAEKAYREFREQALTWLETNPGGSVTTALISFSRGDASAAIFSQILYERGLVASNGEVLIPPGELGVSAAVILDPVTTGVSGNLGFAPNVQNVAVVIANNETRFAFRAVDLAQNPGVTVFNVVGNHCDIGGGYDNGIGALVLQAATQFLRNSGIQISDVFPERRYVDGTIPVIHTEAVDTRYTGPDGQPQQKWSEYTGPRLFDGAANPATQQTLSDGTTITTFTDVKGGVMTVTRRPGETSSATDAEGTYTVTTSTSLVAVNSLLTGNRQFEVVGSTQVNRTPEGAIYQVITRQTNIATDGITNAVTHTSTERTINYAPDQVTILRDVVTVTKPDNSRVVSTTLQDGTQTIDRYTPNNILTQSETTTIDGTTGTIITEARTFDPVTGVVTGTTQTAIYPDGNRMITVRNGTGATEQIQTIVTDPVTQVQTVTIREFDPLSPAPEPTMTTVTVTEADGSSTASTTAGSSLTVVHKDKDGKTDRVETDISDGNGGRINQKIELDGNGQIKKRTETKTDADGDTQVETQDITPDAINEAQDRVDAPSAPQTRRDPLILDLNNNGIATTNAATNGLHFDHDGNGFAEASGWIKGDDAFLAFDRNGNGTIDTGLELFGDQTVLRSGAKAATGLQALSEWDSNRDGRISAADARFADLRVWRDLNQDGISQANELQTLTDAGIAAINLAGTATNAPADANGNTLTRRGTFTRLDGTTGASGEVTLKRDTTLSVPVTNYTVSDSIAAQPDLSGYGNLLDLHQALAREAAAGGTAPLAASLTTYQDAASSAARETALDNLLYTWANASGIAPASRGGAMDARKITFLETVFGQALGNPDSNAATQWTMSWQQVREYYGGSLLAQTSLKPLFDQIQYRWDAQSQTLKADLSAVESLLQDSLAADPASGRTQLADFARAIKGLGAEDSVNYLALRETFFEQDPELAWAMDSAGLKVYDRKGQGQRAWSPHVEGTDGSEAVHGSLTEGDGYINSLYGHDTIWGTTRNEVLINEAGNSLLYGGDGSDNLMAGAGDDILDGGRGNDTLQGEAGNDTYLFRKGSGFDRIQGWNRGDRVWLAVNPDEAAFSRSGNDLQVGFADRSDRLVIAGYYSSAPVAGQTVVSFRDGTNWTNAEIAGYFTRPHIGFASDDTLLGSQNPDSLDGHGGNDVLVGNGGEDTLIGGTGDDTIYGAAAYDRYGILQAQRGANGNDSYIYNRGDDNDSIIDLDPSTNSDTLRFGAGIDPGDVRASLMQGSTGATRDLLLSIGNTSGGGSVRIKEALDANGVAMGKIERFEFADGTVWRNESRRWRDGEDVLATVRNCTNKEWRMAT